MNKVWQKWSADVGNKINEHTRDVRAHQADIAVLIDAVLRKDAEVDELRALVAALERRVIELEGPVRWTSDGMRINIPPINTHGPFTVTYTSDNTGGHDGT